MQPIDALDRIPFKCDICANVAIRGVKLVVAPWVAVGRDETNEMEICDLCVLKLVAICPPDAQTLPPEKLLIGLAIANMNGLVRRWSLEILPPDEKVAIEKLQVDDAMRALIVRLEKLF